MKYLVMNESISEKLFYYGLKEINGEITEEEKERYERFKKRNQG